MFPGVPNVARKVYKRHFLNSVHCQLTQSGVEADLIVGKKEELQSTLSDFDFGAVQYIEDGSFSFGVNQDGAQHINTSRKVTGLIFTKKEPHTTFQITETGFVYSCYAYRGFDDFAAEYLALINAIGNIIPRRIVEKIGLRKINSIMIGPIESIPSALTIFNDNLFSTLRSGLGSVSTVKHLDGTLVLEQEADTCVIRHSLHSTDVSKSFEARLDCDLIREGQFSTEDIFPSKLIELNDISFNVFDWCVTDKLKALMES